MADWVIRVAETDADIDRCFPVMSKLRPHLARVAFVETVRRQSEGGFVLAYLSVGEVIHSVAGFRQIDNLVGGRILYVDDLVTDDAARSRGYGKALLDWLAERARAAGCQFLELDSGVQRFDAHRFYFVNRMHISSYHFRLKL